MDTESTDVLKQLLERLDKMDCHQQKLDRVMDCHQQKLDRVMERLDTLQNIVEKQNKKQNLLDEQLVAITIKQAEGDNTNKYRAELEYIHSSINSLLESVQGKLTTVLEKVDCTEASMISRHTTVINQVKELSTDAKVKEQLETLTSELKDCMCMTKHEIFAVTEKEAQLVRDRIQGPLPCIKNYTFDFYVNNFKSLVRSGKDVLSLPWHVNELQTCVTGCVILLTNGEMGVWLLQGRHAREVGLQPRSGKTLKVKATICDILNKTLPTLDVGEINSTLTEADIPWNDGYGLKLGVTSCDTLLEKGYGDQEGYKHGALLIRYEVTVLSLQS